LKVSVEKLEKSAVMLTIEVDKEQVEQALQIAARKIAQKTNIPGFRRGKAPYAMVLQTFGRAAVMEEALGDLGQTAFAKALEETKIEPYAQAKMVDIQMDPLVLKMRVPTAPTVDLGDYRSLRLESPAVEVSDEQVDKAVDNVREQNATWVPVERGATLGDMVTITIAANKEKASEPSDLVLEEESRYPLPGFQAKLIDATAGSELEFNLTIPADWPDKSMAGQIQAFHVQVQEVKQKELPALEELPAIVGDYEDLEALKAGIRKDLAEREAQRNDQQLLQKALDILSEQATIEYPEEVEEEQLDRLLSRQNVSLGRQGMNLESYQKALKVTAAEYREQQRPSAIKALRRTLVLSELAAREKLDLKKEELEQELTARADKAGQYMEEKAAREMVDMLASQAGQNVVASDLITNKVYQRVLDIVKGQAPELPPEAPAATEVPAEAPTAEAPAATPTAAEPAAEAQPAGEVAA